ncbi:hypothetical protein HYS84_00260 [Candidatus Saccharibacteria bacterium]|nr:hypothetical protein [Candidatus Saccharibacteria bacterium]
MTRHLVWAVAVLVTAVLVGAGVSSAKPPKYPDKTTTIVQIAVQETVTDGGTLKIGGRILNQANHRVRGLTLVLVWAWDNASPSPSNELEVTAVRGLRYVDGSHRLLRVPTVNAKKVRRFVLTVTAPDRGSTAHGSRNPLHLVVWAVVIRVNPGDGTWKKRSRPSTADYVES